MFYPHSVFTCFVWISMYDVSAELTGGTNQYLVIAEVRERLSISQQAAQWFD